MEYREILDRVKKQRNAGEVNSKLFWYVGLIQAIELFSQKLNFDQVVYTCMDCISELLTVEKSAIYVQHEDKYVLKRYKGYTDCIEDIDDTQQLRDLPIYHGGLLYNDTSKKYFEGKIIDQMEVRIVVPLIIENDLFGFIFIGSKIEGDYDRDNYTLAEALMRLFNNALENYKTYEEIQKINSELDEKVFNLFAINQSSKVLLSELDIYKLYSLAVDVFSELTQSSVTSFILYDKQSASFILKSYRNIFNVNEKVGMVVRYNSRAQIEPYRIILNVDIENDKEYLKSIFPDLEEMITKLKAKYFVLLLRKQELLGVVTLGTNVTGQEYKSSIFELIESLATSTYIAISNAELFEKVNEQRDLINRKFEKLVMLNNLMKNINSSKSLNIMVELVLKTLGIAFKAEKALVARYDRENNSFTIMDTLGFKTKKRKLKVTKEWKRVLEGDLIYEGERRAVKAYIKDDLLQDVGDFSGIVISPITIEDLDSTETYGVVIVLKYKDTLITDEENRVIVQTISNHIAPIMASFDKLEEQARTLVPNYVEYFKIDLKKAIDDARKFKLDLEVIDILLNERFPFTRRPYYEVLSKIYKNLYPISPNNIFIINTNHDHDIENDIREKISGEIAIRRYKIDRDFTSYEDFFKLF